MYRVAFHDSPYAGAHINILELFILTKAIEITKESSPTIRLFTDSRVAMAWAQKGVKDGATDVMVIELVQRLRAASRGRDIVLEYIPSKLNPADSYSQKITGTEWNVRYEDKERILRLLEVEGIHLDCLASVGGRIGRSNITCEDNLFEQGDILKQYRNRVLWVFPPREITFRTFWFLQENLAHEEGTIITGLVHIRTWNTLKSLFRNQKKFVWTETQEIRLVRVDLKSGEVAQRTAKHFELILIKICL